VTAHDPVRVVVAGAGVAGLETIIALRALAADRVAITLVAPGTHFVYEPYSTAAPFSELDVPRHSLAQFAKDFDTELVTDSIDWVLPHDRRLFLRSGRELGYDALVLAVGARRYPAWPNAVPFRGFRDAAAVRRLIDEVHNGQVGRLAFVVPPAVAWTLPIYELALQVAADIRPTDADTALTLVTHEASPLEIFGENASTEMLELLRDAGVALEIATHADARPQGYDRVVALPLIEGPGIHGVPSDQHGFVQIDPYGFVRGVAHVYAAGDCVQSPLKQGGLAAQQADVVAEAVARQAGMPVEQRALQPVLRGLLLTGEKRRFFRRDPQGADGAASEVQERPLWWPAVKLAGRHLAPYLKAEGVTPERDTTPVEVTLAERAPVEGG
jgi:sulfide:quinone oxidoreductase